MIKPRKTIENITPYQTDKYYYDWRLKLDSNENIYGASPCVISAIKNFDEKEISLYPCYGKLLDKLAQKHFLEDGNILLTNGCDEALNIIINTYMEPQDEFLSFNPSFSMPALYTKIMDGVVKHIDYDEKFVFNYEKVLNSKTDKTKIFYLATPNNPTGELTKASILEILLKQMEDVLFIVDCTYINFAQDVTFQDYLDLIKTYKNLVVVKSFSKDFALAGLRLGFIAADKEIISNLKKVSSPYNVNAIALHCALSVLNDDKFERVKELNLKAKEALEEELKKAGYHPYPSQANFILCDFYNHTDFYYEKLKKNGVIVRNFPKNSPISTCLRITVPTMGGVKFIAELLKKKDVLIFDMDGVIFDVNNSYMEAIAQTYKHFSAKDISKEKILEVKNLGGMNCDWDATQKLLSNDGFNIEIEEVIKVFQDLFFNPQDKAKTHLIDKEELLISKETFEKLSKRYDMVIFSGRLKEEALYSLKKYDIDKYFYFYVTSDDLAKHQLKPHPLGVLNILKHCPNLSVKYIGDSVDDIIAGNSAEVTTIGVISPEADFNVMVNNFRHLRANYILDDIKKLEYFLEDIEKENAKNI